MLMDQIKAGYSLLTETLAVFMTLFNGTLFARP